MKVLVTGGAGFIGSHLVERLLMDGNDVVVIDDMSMGKRENLPEHDRLKVYEKNMMSIYPVNHFFEGVDVVYHLAALTRPRESFKNPEKTFLINVDGTRSMLSLANLAGVRRFVYISSATVYGHAELPMRESMTDLQPISPYGKSKLEAEDLVRIHCNLFRMEFNTIRPFNVYGARQNPNGEYGAAIPKFIWCLKNGEVPCIAGDGEQYRDFIYVKDLVDLIVKAGESNIHGHVFNGGSGERHTVNQIYRKITTLMGKNVEPGKKFYVKEPNTLADVSKAEELLGWTPKTTLEEGLKTMI